MENKIAYIHKKSRRAKRVRLAVYCDGRVVVTSPFGVKPSIVEKFLNDKKNWIWRKIHFFKSLAGSKIIRTFSPKDYLENKDKAYELLHNRVKFYNEIYGFPFNKIFIRNQKTRWGSCSHKRNLNFNYKIIFLPERYQNYIIVHELCHLKEMNHSKRFWTLVEKSLPNYLDLKKELHHHNLFY